GRLPSIGFMRPFGCPVTILNTLDPLGIFKGRLMKDFLLDTLSAARHLGDQEKEQGDKAVNKDKGKSPVVTITGFRDLNKEFAECINNSSNGVSAAGPLVSAVGLEF
nr:ribonuclease H-like domain-containing protein [Tanacetum cinerariifolium]